MLLGPSYIFESGTRSVSKKRNRGLSLRGGGITMSGKKPPRKAHAKGGPRVNHSSKEKGKGPSLTPFKGRPPGSREGQEERSRQRRRRTSS